MMDDGRKATPSLLEPQSRGGDTAEGGFSFQDQVMLSRIPIWLAHDGFTATTRESIGDTEAKFFVPGRGFVRELVEVRDHSLTPSEFWSEIKRFQDVDTGDPGTYCWFTLVSTGLSQGLKPLENGLRRVRDPYDFYDDGSAAKDNSFADYIEIVNRLGYSDREARFLFEKVFIDADWSSARSHGEALFRQSLVDHLPEYADLPSRTLGDIYANLSTFIRGRRNQPVNRTEIEIKLREEIDAELLPPLRPVSIYTSAQDGNAPVSGLRFKWAQFFGGENRSFPPTERWNNQLLGELEQTRDWITRHRSTRRIRLEGSRRLSASLAIGSVFSAVTGFAIEMNYRGESWATDAHPGPNAPAYSLACQRVEGAGKHLVVSVGILRDIAPEVESCLDQHALTGMPVLHIKGEEAIISPQHANNAVRAIKNVISDAVVRTGSSQVHLFIAAPAFLALFLGHRLNGIAPIQCYEWSSPGYYAPTCQLFSIGDHMR